MNKVTFSTDNLDNEERRVIGYIRVSTDDQDLYKQRETIEYYCKRNDLVVTRFVKVEISSRRSIVSQRTKEALRVLKEKGIKLGKPFGTLQKSMLDQYKDKIREWCRFGFPYRRQAKVLNVSFSCLYHYVRSRNLFCSALLRNRKTKSKLKPSQ